MTTTVPDLHRPPTATPARHHRPWRPAAVAAAGVLAGGWPAVAGPYPVTLAATALVFALLACSTQLLVGVAGLPAFGQAAYLGVGAYTAALLARAGHPSGLEHLAAGTATAALAGAITAPIVLRTRGAAFLMATLALQTLTVTAASQWRGVTGGDEGLSTPTVTVWPGGPALATPAVVYWYVLAIAVLAGLALAVVLRSPLALALRGIAGHEPRMIALGHRVTGRLIAGYTLAAGLAGAAGALLVAVNRYISPADLGFDVASLALLAATIGAGSMTGACAGGVLIVAVRDGVGISSGGLSPLLLGLVFVLVAYRESAQESTDRLRGRLTGRSRR